MVCLLGVNGNFFFLFGKILRSFSQIGNFKILKNSDLKAFSDEL